MVGQAGFACLGACGRFFSRFVSKTIF